MIETVASYYDRCVKEFAPKARKSLERLKSACDQIQINRGKMDYASVSRVATKSYGGPAYSSILNNGKLKLYIDLRKGEYERSGQTKTLTKPGDNSEKPRYPRPDLDARTRLFIDQQWTYIEQLENRNRLLEAAQNELTGARSVHTKVEEPLDYAEIISRGPEGVHLQIDYRPPHPLASKAKEAITNLLGLVEKIENLKIEERDGKKMLVCERHSGRETILTPAHFRALEASLGMKNDG